MDWIQVVVPIAKFFFSTGLIALLMRRDKLDGETVVWAILLWKFIGD